MTHHVLELGPKGQAHARRTLQEYLPGLSLGLAPLSANRLLVPASTMRALTLEYGQGAVAAILAKAGATGAIAVDDAGAVALLRSRERAALPKRAGAAPAAAVDWHLATIRAPQAWQMLGGPGGIDWAGVRVGHIDTGYTRHPVFGFGATPWILEDLGQTFFAGETEMDDPGPGGGVDPIAFSMDGHGTRTASTICGHAPGASGGAFFGVAPKVPLVPVRIANHVGINHAQQQFAAAVRHLVDVAGVQVISLSMGLLPIFISKALRSALNHAYDAGVIVVCAAGNVVQNVVAPACLSRTLAIAGVTAELAPWGGSAHGPEVDISGPAEGIRRAEMGKNGKPGYAGGGDGTSYATAMTAGAAALWLARHRAALGSQYPQAWQRVEGFKAALRASTQVPAIWQPGSFGTGVLDVHRLLQEALPPAAAHADQAA